MRRTSAREIAGSHVATLREAAAAQFQGGARSPPPCVETLGVRGKGPKGTFTATDPSRNVQNEHRFSQFLRDGGALTV